MDVPAEVWSPLPLPNFTFEEHSFSDVMAARQTRRKFSPISLEQLANVLWLCQRRTEFSRHNEDRSKGPLPTAGGFASVRTIVVTRNSRPWIYDSRRHSAGDLPTTPDAVFDDAEEFMQIGDGCILLFAAFRNYIGQYYDHPESLVMRESGGIQTVMSILSEVLGLSFCPLGTQGHEWSASILGVGKEVIVPGGAAVIGGR